MTIESLTIETRVGKFVNDVLERDGIEAALKQMEYFAECGGCTEDRRAKCLAMAARSARWGGVIPSDCVMGWQS